jgi:hypothetical protein
LLETIKNEWYGLSNKQKKKYRSECELLIQLAIKGELNESNYLDLLEYMKFNSPLEDNKII